MGWKPLHRIGAKGCHNCRHAGRYVGTPYMKTPCAVCDGGEAAMIQGHGRVFSFDSYAGGLADTSAEEEAGCVVEAVAAEVGETRDAEAVAADAERLADAVAAVVYTVATLTLGQVVTVWNHLKGGTLDEAGNVLGVTKQRAGYLLHSGLARLGVAEVLAADTPASRKLQAIQCAAREAVQAYKAKPAPKLADTVRGEGEPEPSAGG